MRTPPSCPLRERSWVSAHGGGCPHSSPGHWRQEPSSAVRSIWGHSHPATQWVLVQDQGSQPGLGPWSIRASVCYLGLHPVSVILSLSGPLKPLGSEAPSISGAGVHCHASSPAQHLSSLDDWGHPAKVTYSPGRSPTGSRPRVTGLASRLPAEQHPWHPQAGSPRTF